MKSISIFILIIFSAILISCGDKKETSGEKTTDTTATKEQETTPKPAFTSKEIIKSYENCNPDSASCTYIKIQYTEVTEGAAKDSINAHINNILLTTMYPLTDSTYSSLDALADGFLKDYVTTKREIPDLPGAWYLDAALIDTAGTEKIISFKQNFDMFTGGAHPVYYEFYYNFNSETGDTIALSDIFKPGFEKELTSLVVSKFRKDQNLAGNEPLTKAGLFEDSLSYNNNFLLTKEGITFHYNIYEIWSYAQGTLDIFIPYAGLKGILKENGIY